MPIFASKARKSCLSVVNHQLLASGEIPKNANKILKRIERKSKMTVGILFSKSSTQERMTTKIPTMLVDVYRLREWYVPEIQIVPAAFKTRTQA